MSFWGRANVRCSRFNYIANRFHKTNNLSIDPVEAIGVLLAQMVIEWERRKLSSDYIRTKIQFSRAKKKYVHANSQKKNVDTAFNDMNSEF